MEQEGRRLAINFSGDDAFDTLLLTHARRDIVRAARDSTGARVFAGAKSCELLIGAERFWFEWWEGRFDYYKQQVTQLPTENWDEVLTLPAGSFDWHGLPIQILETPGYTVDAVSFLVELDGAKVAFVGDLLLAGGKVRDLYSFQNEIREAKVGAYHGHLGRLHVWLESLTKLKAEKPDFLVPSRGPISKKPVEDIDRAMTLAKSIYENYLRTNALHWYFGEERMGTCAELVLGESHGVVGMPFAEHIDLPDWCRHIGTTKLLVSDSGKGFALDVGGARSLETLQQIAKDSLISGLDGVFATHTHNDHTAAIADAAIYFGCPVYATAEVGDVLEYPGHWFLPGVSNNSVESVRMVEDRETMQWEEFQFTFFFFPGQMLNHSAMLVERSDHDPVFFIGDSFSPSGIDDYCLMNRNLMREDSGYLLCFDILRELPESTWLVNQHIPHLFRFSEEERRLLREQYEKRAEMIRELVAWDDINFAIDEQWTSFYPYGQTAVPGQTIETRVEIWNHSTEAREYAVSLFHPDVETGSAKTVSVEARERASLAFCFSLPDVDHRQYVITADIQRGDGRVERAFCETVIRVGEPLAPESVSE